jgi:hypothetical protein
MYVLLYFLGQLHIHLKIITPSIISKHLPIPLFPSSKSNIMYTSLPILPPPTLAGFSPCPN